MRGVVTRLAAALPALVGVVLGTFLLTRVLPGDPAAYFAGPTASAESIAQVKAAMGLDKPLAVQFADYVDALRQGDLGMSLTTGQPVIRDLAARLPASAELTLCGLLLAVVVAIPMGIMAAVRQGSWIDQLCRTVSTAGVSLPVFFTGLLLVYVFYFLLGWAPAPVGRLDAYATAPPTRTGFYLVDSLIAGDAETFRGALAQLVLPATTLGLFALAPIARITRASMLATLDAEFVRTARASGLTPLTVVIRYAFRNSLLPVVDLAGHGLLVPAGCQRAGGEGVRVAGGRVVCGRGADRLRLRAGAGVRARDGDPVRGAEPDRRHGQPGARSAGPRSVRAGAA